MDLIEGTFCLQTESRKGYDLDRSLFERLVKDGFPMVTLELQRRMRPCIANLIRNTIYPSLQVRLTDKELQYDACAFLCGTASGQHPIALIPLATPGQCHYYQHCLIFY